MLCPDVLVQVILPRGAGTSFNGELASFIWTVKQCGFLNCLRVFGFAVTVKVFLVPEGSVAYGHRAFKRWEVGLKMLAVGIISVPTMGSKDRKCLLQEIPLGKCLWTFFALKGISSCLRSEGAGSLRRRT
jgi:hypothetical protein